MLLFTQLNSKISKILLTKILLISGLFTIFITGMQLYSEYQNETARLTKQIKLIEMANFPALSTAMFNSDEPLIKQISQGIKKYDGIVFVKVATKFRKVYTFGDESKNSDISIVYPIFYGSNDIGSISLSASKKFIEEKIKDQFFLILAAQAIKTFIVAIFILFFMHQLIVRHVIHISSWLKAFRPDVAFNPIPYISNKEPKNEIDELKLTISAMGKHVHEHSTSLERLVEQRTAELNKRNFELESTQQKLHKILWKKEKMLEGVSESISDWLWELDQFGNLVMVSKEFSQVTGLSIDKTSPQQLLNALPFFSGESALKVKDNIQTAIDNKTAIESIICCLKSIEGEEVWLLLTASPYFAKAGEFLGYHGSAKDITQQKHLEKLAYIDGLTGISNRLSFFYKADKEYHRSKRLSYDVGVMMLDLDHFKLVNDTYGHAAGDEVLQKVSQVMAGCLRSEDCIGRIGGEEFAIVVPGADKLGLHHLASRLRDIVKLQEFSFLGKGKSITISMGYTMIKNNEGFKSALQRADEHLYKAKTNGRNCFVTEPEFVPNLVS